MVTVYTTENCAFCPMVKKFLQFKKINYKEVDVTTDNAMRNKLFAQTGLMSVPVTTDGENFVVGYNPAALTKFVQSYILNV